MRLTGISRLVRSRVGRWAGGAAAGGLMAALVVSLGFSGGSTVSKAPRRHHTGAATAAVPICQGSQLSAPPVQILGAGARVGYLQQDLKNVSAVTCELRGYPRLGFALGGAAGTPTLQATLDGTTTDFSTWKLALVVLGPGASAVFYELAPQGDQVPGGACPGVPVVTATFDVLIPGSSTPVVTGSSSIPDPTICGAPQIPITVSPFLANGTPSGMLQPTP